MPRRRLLDSTELFTAMPPEVLDGLRERAVVERVAKGQAVFDEGDEADRLFVVTEGRIAIASRASDGRETLVAVMEAGGLFGELGLFDGEPRSADARALTDAEVLSVDYASVRAAFEARPELLWLVVRLLAQRLRATDEALADAVFLDVPARTAKRMLELAGGRDEFQLPMTQEDLAGLVGASRERVNKAIAMFTRLGWVETTGRGHYRILDRDSLAQRAEQ
ncbi:MAG: Crp/Fnr family transcriptional regulator [Actinomycetes bacterium]